MGSSMFCPRYLPWFAAISLYNICVVYHTDESQTLGITANYLDGYEEGEKIRKLTGNLEASV